MQRTVLVALHVLAGTIVVVGLGVLLLWLLQTRVVGTETAAGRVWLAELGVVVILVLVLLLLWAWLHPILKLAGRRRRDAFWLAAVVVFALTAFLSSRETPDSTVSGVLEQVFTDIDDELRAHRSGHDVVLVLDTSDPGARRLVRAARARPEELATSHPLAVDQDVRFGLVVLTPGDSLFSWRVHQPLTADRFEVVSALAGLEIEGAEPSAAAWYSAAIFEARAPASDLDRELGRDLGWRLEAAHSIVLVADHLPTRRELDAGLRRDAPASGPFSASSWEQKLPRRRSPEVAPWGSPSFSLSVVTNTRAGAHVAAWRRWTALSGGKVVLPTGFEGVRSALDGAELAAIGGPNPRLQRLAEKYRPFLFFDSEERFGVLNVDEFLREQDVDGAPRHKACEHHWDSRLNSCRPLRSAGDLRPKDDYIDIGDEPTDERPIGDSGAIYYEVVPKRNRLQLVYWWFFRYNESPVWSRFNCRAGLAIAEATCFDHEGDWEGVTVTLDKETERPRSVTYYGHGWPGYRFAWKVLEGVGSTSGNHPHVYVAFGSHASYPVSCDLPGLRCKQFIYERYGQVLPDGRHDGAVTWFGNEKCDECVQPLPVVGRGEPASWNRYAVRWGASECTRIAKLCLKAEGPRTPSTQPRKMAPKPAKDLSLDFLKAFAAR